MLLIVCMRIYGDRVVSSDLRGEGVDFIFGRFKTTLVFRSNILITNLNIVVVSQQKFLFQTRSFLISNNSAYASMKKAKYFVYVH